MKQKLIQAIGVGFAATTVGAFAGEVTVIPDSAPSEPSRDWCDTLKKIGTVYKNKENPFIQEVKFFGRAHYQYGYTDGRASGSDFHGDGDMLRRLRFGTSIKFLNGFKATAGANFSEPPGYRNVEIDYYNFDQINLEYTFQNDVLGFEDVTLGYGRYKVAVGGEEHTSSKKIKTIERSNINNYYAPKRLTGGKIMAKRNDIDYTLGAFTTDFDLETFGQWNGGTAYYASMEFEAGKGDVILDFLYNDATQLESAATVNYEWAASATYDRDFGSFDLFTNVTFGEDHEGNEAYGIVLMPSKELIEDKLEAVVRYQWAHSSGDDRLRAQGRNVRNTAAHDNVATFRGNDLHSVYAGLNYFVCDHNMKVMTGVEYENLDGDNGRTEATTLWAAFRMYF